MNYIRDLEASVTVIRNEMDSIDVLLKKAQKDYPGLIPDDVNQLSTVEKIAIAKDIVKLWRRAVYINQTTIPNP